MSSPNKIALVTGSSRGIGRGIALRLARDGFDVAVNDLPEHEKQLKAVVGEIQALGRKSISVVADVSKDEEVKGMVDIVSKELGGLDVMVANAGISFAKSLLKTSVEDWDEIFSTNARGIFLCYKYAALQMIAQGRGGRIIGASSVAGKQGEKGFSAYSATKFAIRGLTQSTAQELGQFGITVNTYCPGGVETYMTQNLADQLGVSADFIRQQEKDATPMGRMGTTEDVAHVVSFLASKESGWITDIAEWRSPLGMRLA
ncbi:hypothetical protein AX16_008246 [Volvariella volvacea WC 439]|nr:hypothetical protein AX16_008246 [Volvariella volvacea WC 439]